MGLYFLFGSFNPTTAVGNRIRAYVQGLSELGVQATVCFFHPDDNQSVIEGDMPNVCIKYFWKECYIRHRLFKYIPYYFSILAFRRSLAPGDRVYMYDLNDVPLFLFRKKNIRIFYEKTESPLVSNYGSLLRRVSIEDHLSDCKRYAGLFVISNALKEYYVDQGINKDKIHVINVIVDPNRFKGIKRNPRERYIAYCGNANNNKDGVDILIKSFALIHSSHPDVKLYIIGPTPRVSDVNNNIDLVNRLGISKNVVFLGRRAPNDIPQLLINASVLALARPNSIQAKYGFPTKLGEYLLSGNPVVVTRVGDMPLFLKDNNNALIAEPDNVISFGEKLSWALDNPKEASIIGNRGKQLAISMFNYLIETKKIVRAMLSDT